MPKRGFSTIIFVLLAYGAFAQNGELWGHSSPNLGFLFKTGADGTGAAIKHQFAVDPSGNSNTEPPTELTEVSGKLYGVAPNGGTNDNGVIYEFNPSSGVYTKRLSFTDPVLQGFDPNRKLALGANGKLYGVTFRGGLGLGVLFEFDPVSNVVAKKYDFGLTGRGSYPINGLALGANNKLYGVTQFGTTGSTTGAIYEYDPVTATGTFKAEFSAATGYYTNAALTLYSDGKLYGTTQSGGAHGSGTIFQFDPSTGTITKKFDFSGSDGTSPVGGLAIGADLKFYGTTTGGGSSGGGTIFSFDPTNNTFVKILDFVDPNATSSAPKGTLALGANNHFYGAGTLNGTGHNGALFEFDPTAGIGTGLTVRYSVPNDANQPNVIYAGLTLSSNGKLYGTTTRGLHGGGTIFEFNPSGNVYTKKYDFVVATDGTWYNGKLEQIGNKVYGVTMFGGSANKGTIFEYDLVTRNYTVKFNFDDYVNTGWSPVNGLTQYNGKLYGVTTSGGANAAGILFEYDPVGNVFLRKVSFDPATQGQFSGVKMVLLNSKLYGGLTGSGINSCLFEYVPGASTITLKYVFDNSTGQAPNALVVNGTKLYGTAANGGANSAGTFFAYDPSAGFNKLFDFGSGSEPTGSLAVTADNKVYGTTSGGGASGAGVIYEYGTSMTVKYSFTGGNDGSSPKGGVTLSSNGNLYGTTLSGGSQSGYGVFFEYNPGTNTYTKKFDFSPTETGNSPQNPLTLINSPLSPQVITFNTIPDKAYGDAPFDLTATASSGLPVSYKISFVGGANVATLSGKTITINGTGVVTVVASQAGDATYSEVGNVVQTFSVNRGQQTITFATQPDRTLGDPPFTVNATASSGLPVTFSGDTEIVVSGNTVTMIKPGLTYIEADQAGNNLYNFAPATIRSFCVLPAKPTITADDFNPVNVTLTSSTTSALVTNYQWYLNGKQIDGATSQTYKIAAPGSYTVTTSVEGCRSQNSDAKTYVVTGDLEPANRVNVLYPNPATSKLSVQLDGYSDEKPVELAIYDLQGKMVDHLRATGQTTIEIDIAHYANGQYILRSAQDGKVDHNQFIKK